MNAMPPANKAIGWYFLPSSFIFPEEIVFASVGVKELATDQVFQCAQ